MSKRIWIPKQPTLSAARNQRSRLALVMGESPTSIKPLLPNDWRLSQPHTHAPYTNTNPKREKTHPSFSLSAIPPKTSPSQTSQGPCAARIPTSKHGGAAPLVLDHPWSLGPSLGLGRWGCLWGHAKHGSAHPPLPLSTSKMPYALFWRECIWVGLDGWASLQKPMSSLTCLSLLD